MHRHYSDADISTTEIGVRLLKGGSRSLGVMSPAMENTNPSPKEIEFYEDLAWRLKLAVETIDRPKGEIAASIGVSQQRLSNWITNQNKPDWFYVARFCRRYSISAEWVLLGDLRGVPHLTADRWERAVAEKRGPAQEAEHQAIEGE